MCSLKKAKEWTKSQVKIKPYKSELIPTVGASRCSVSFASTSVPVIWHIIKEDCEPVLAGMQAKQLGIIKFNAAPNQNDKSK